MSRAKINAGVTLLELMIVVAIVGILAAIAYPSYSAYIARANRGDAQQTLMQAAQRAERYYVTNGASGYTNFTISSTTNSDLLKSPSNGTAVYNLSVVSATATGFLIRACPVAVSVPSGSPCTASATDSNNKRDGYMTIDQAGAKRWDRNNNGVTTDTNEDNWNR